LEVGRVAHARLEQPLLPNGLTAPLAVLEVGLDSARGIGRELPVHERCDIVTEVCH
jgi:hypothetical protein